MMINKLRVPHSDNRSWSLRQLLKHRITSAWVSTYAWWCIFRSLLKFFIHILKRPQLRNRSGRRNVNSLTKHGRLLHCQQPHNSCRKQSVFASLWDRLWRLEPPQLSIKRAASRISFSCRLMYRLLRSTDCSNSDNESKNSRILTLWCRCRVVGDSLTGRMVILLHLASLTTAPSHSGTHLRRWRASPCWLWPEAKRSRQVLLTCVSSPEGCQDAQTTCQHTSYCGLLLCLACRNRV